MTRSTWHLTWMAFVLAALLATHALIPTAAGAAPANRPKPDLVIVNICRIGDGAPHPDYPDDPRWVSGGHLVITVANGGNGRANAGSPFDVVWILKSGRIMAQAFVDVLNPHAEVEVHLTNLLLGPTGTEPPYIFHVDAGRRITETDENNNRRLAGIYFDIATCQA